MYLLVILSLIVLLGIILQPLYTYCIDPHQLRRFPSAHPFAPITNLWIVARSLTRSRHAYITAAHARHGSIVRIAPTHLSFSDPRAYKEIYGFGNSIIKDDFYSNVAGGNPSMSQTVSREVHARKRRWMSHVFSAKEIGAVEPRVRERVGVLLRSLKTKSRGDMVSEEDEYVRGKGWRYMRDGCISFDLRPWLNMLSYDAITAMFWSNTYGCLERGSDSVSVLRANGKRDRAHAMASFHGTTGFLVPIAHLRASWQTPLKRLLTYTTGAKNVQNFGDMVRHLVTHRMACPPSTPDLFSSIPSTPTPKRPDPVPIDEIMAECTTMMDAGNDTTQTSLTNAIFHLALYPTTQNRLRDELEATLSAESKPVASYQDLQHIPYLRAVLDESFRCRPPVAFGLPRRTIETTTICGHKIAAGTTISSPLSALHLSEDLFSNASTFIPERWLPHEDNGNPYPHELANLKDFVLPFSIGPRACIGRNLAYMELSIVIAALVLAFGWELDDEKHMNRGFGERDGLEVVERLNANPKELWVRAVPRELEA